MDAGDAYLLALDMMEGGASIPSVRRRFRSAFPGQILEDIIAAAYDDFRYRKERTQSDSTDEESTEAGNG
jgi:hypothetical protein